MKSREILAFSILGLVIISIAFFMNTSNTNITGFVSTDVKRAHLGLEFNETQAFTLQGEEISNLNSLRVSGEVINNGSVDIYLVNEEGQSLLVYSNKPTRTTNTITGFVIDENCDSNAWVCEEWSEACIWEQQIRECFNQCGEIVRELKPCEVEGYGTCNNSILNYNETDLDCGGVCSPCLEGSKCKEDKDCITGECSDYGRCYNSSKIIDITGLTIVGHGGGVAITEDDVTPWEEYTEEEQQIEDQQEIITETEVDIEEPIIPEGTTEPETEVTENIEETDSQEPNEITVIPESSEQQYEEQPPLTLTPIPIEGVTPIIIKEGMSESEIMKNINLMLGRVQITGEPEGDITFENKCVDSCNLPKNGETYKLVVEVEEGTTLKLDSILYTSHS